jgi:CHAD domain-containing protein
MHAFLEAEMNEKPALQPNAAIGPTLRAIAALTIAKARSAITNPELSGADAVHEFRRTMKRWRALMRLLEPFVPDALLMRQQARDHARSLTKARDGQSALNAFDDVVKSGNLLLSERTIGTIRSRIEATRSGEEDAVLTPELRDAIMAWLDSVTDAIALWPLDPFEFSKIAARLTVGYRNARRAIPDDWSQASAE